MASALDPRDVLFMAVEVLAANVPESDRDRVKRLLVDGFIKATHSAETQAIERRTARLNHDLCAQLGIPPVAESSVRLRANKGTH